nr:aldo/keto reductase [Treponema sp.]
MRRAVKQFCEESDKGNRSLFSDPVINEIARNHGKTAAQVILRWHPQMGFVVIPGSKNVSHILVIFTTRSLFKISNQKLYF